MDRAPSYESQEVKDGLLANVEAACSHLLPNGRRVGREYVCGNVRGDPGDSLKVTLEGTERGLWFDFADPDVAKVNGGDPLGLWMTTRNLSFPEAIAEVGDWLRLPQRAHKQAKRSVKVEKPLEPINLPPLDRGTVSELTTLRNQRGLPTTAGMQILTDRGQFGFGWLGNHRAWFITDATQYAAQVRRLDGKPIPIGTDKTTKAKTLPGSCASWPVGAATITADTRTVYLCEGGPDLIAAITGVWMERGRIDSSEAFVAMLGASQRIHAQAQPLFAGKHARIFGHADDAGRKSVETWGRQIVHVGAAKVTSWESDRGCEDLNDYIARHWADSDEPAATWPERLGVLHA